MGYLLILTLTLQGVSDGPSIASLFGETRHHKFNVIYIPEIDLWWDSLEQHTRSQFLLNWRSVNLVNHVCILATCQSSWNTLPEALLKEFKWNRFTQLRSIHEITSIDESDIKAFWDRLKTEIAAEPPARSHQLLSRHGSVIKVLPMHFNENAIPPAPPVAKVKPESAKLPTLEEIEELEQQCVSVLRKVRKTARDVLVALRKDRDYIPFLKAVDRLKYPEYYDVIENPLDADDIMEKIEDGKYFSLDEVLNDLALIAQNTIQFFHPRSNMGQKVRGLFIFVIFTWIQC